MRNTSFYSLHGGKENARHSSSRARVDHFQRSTIDPRLHGCRASRATPRDNYDKTGAGKAELIIQWRACAHVNCVPQREMPRGGCPSILDFDGTARFLDFHFFRVDLGFFFFFDFWCVYVWCICFGKDRGWRLEESSFLFNLDFWLTLVIFLYEFLGICSGIRISRVSRLFCVNSCVQILCIGNFWQIIIGIILLCYIYFGYWISMRKEFRESFISFELFVERWDFRFLACSNASIFLVNMILR